MPPALRGSRCLPQRSAEQALAPCASGAAENGVAMLLSRWSQASAHLYADTNVSITTENKNIGSSMCNNREGSSMCNNREQKHWCFSTPSFWKLDVQRSVAIHTFIGAQHTLKVSLVILLCSLPINLPPTLSTPVCGLRCCAFGLRVCASWAGAKLCWS